MNIVQTLREMEDELRAATGKSEVLWIMPTDEAFMQAWNRHSANLAFREHLRQHRECGRIMRSTFHSMDRHPNLGQRVKRWKGRTFVWSP